MKYTIPIKATPSQTVTILLGGQYCKINIYQKSTGVYCDLLVSDTPIITTRICLDRVYIVWSEYLGFSGDLLFVDTQGKSNPEYTGFNTRYLFKYLTADEL